jgi:threonine synthase
MLEYAAMSLWPGVIERYRPLLDLPAGAPATTLLEGNTPLIPMPRLTGELKAAALFVKYEGLNPSGSFKDRGMTVAITEAVYRGVRTVLCASTGNTAASAAAYAARAGLRAFVLVPEGKVARGKLAGAIAYGAEVLQIKGSFDEALQLVSAVADGALVALVNSTNPYRLEGQKTAAFEICDVLHRAPDWLALPVGNAGNITAYWMGFQQYQREKGTGLPRLLGVQASGAAPLVLGHPIENPETVATAIRIGRPARGPEALQAANESGGAIVAVSDDAILAAQRKLAAEGIWVEPASAAGVAGLIQQVSCGEITLRGQTVVCVCTGHGLKDPETVLQRFPGPRVIPASAGALRDVISS